MTASNNPYAVVNIEGVHLECPHLIPKAEFYNDCKSKVGKPRWWDISITFVIDKGDGEESHDTFSWPTHSKVFLAQTLSFALDEIKSRIAKGTLLRARMVFVIKEKSFDERQREKKRFARREQPYRRHVFEDELKRLLPRG